jgi:hypothetical protein
VRRALIVVVALGVVVVAVVGLGVQAVRGNRTVGVQRNASTIHDAALDNAFYHCLDVQTRSLISPGEPVRLSAVTNTSGLSDVVTLLKGVGSWVTIANPASAAEAQISLRDNVAGPGTCLGFVVVATYAKPHRGVSVRVGSGASVAGNGPPPPAPL